MSNERIDLTQFEGITEGPWVYVEWDDYDADPKYPGSFRGTVSINMYMSDTERVTKWGEHLHYPVISIEDDHGHEPAMLGRKEMRAIAAVPELIAELKRCYEELDRAQCFIQQGWVKFESYTDDGKDLFVDMKDDDGNRFSGWINRAQASE